jgi:MFS family permease
MSFPNIILPLFGGLLLELIGNGNGLLLTTFIMTVGQAVISVGAYSKHFKLLLVGRCLLGIGGETLFVIQAVYTSKWFVD